jgi:hypothetical protein
MDRFSAEKLSSIRLCAANAGVYQVRRQPASNKRLRARAEHALPDHALGPLFAAVEAAATVALVSLQVDAAPSAASLRRTATVEAAAAVALVGAQVYAPLSTVGLPLGASVVIIIGPGYPWKGAQRATYEEATHQPKHLTAREAAAGQGSGQLVEGAIGSFFAHRCPLCPKGGTLGD